MEEMLSKEHVATAVDRLGERFHDALAEFKADTVTDIRELPTMNEHGKIAPAIRSLDQAMIHVAQIMDSLEGRKLSGVHDYKYKGSIMKKVRKALGYNV